MEGNSGYTRQPRGRAPGHAAGARSWKGSATLAVTHFLCPQQGAVARVMLWGVRDSFRSETAPKIVTTSAFSWGKGEAQAGADSSRTLLPASVACCAQGTIHQSWAQHPPGAALWLSRSFRSPQGDTKAGCFCSAAVALAGVPIATDSRGQCHIGAVLCCHGQRGHAGVCLAF